ncbi:MAG: hypothetical protein E6Q93_27165 [Burkholderiaceae bacterium]|jgi:hypothetical protein|nr:MAG: hypothetical protein E6Q93_27165 [Burkholderiaceae bacterium]
MKPALPIPDDALFFERDGLPVFSTPTMSYRSAVTGVVLRSPYELMPISREEFDKLLEDWPPPGSRPLEP